MIWLAAVRGLVQVNPRSGEVRLHRRSKSEGPRGDDMLGLTRDTEDSVYLS